MYCNKENVNILTALLAAYGVRHAVVCPGSRNAPIVHNLNECPTIECYPVTDERSAGFCAIGISLAIGMKPVAVCVTSGSALLNLAPAVAEAFYRHIPLIVISADRPAQWIGQLDGQTLPQPGAFGTMVRKCVTLPEPHNDEEHWMCNRLVCEALYLSTCRTGAPVQINVPITEPLFTFDCKCLPTERTIVRCTRGNDTDLCDTLPDAWFTARRPMVIIGQMPYGAIDSHTLRALSRSFVTLCEPLGADAVHFDEVIRSIGNDANYMPDYILYIGDTVVSKATRRFLRRSGAPSCLLTPDASTVTDPLMHLTHIAQYDSPDALKRLPELLKRTDKNTDTVPSTDKTADIDVERTLFLQMWNKILDTAQRHSEEYEPAYSSMAVVKYFEQQLADMEYDWHVHYANSSAIRLANIFATHHVECNRGVNGIEGSLSTAAGHSMATADMVFCIIGDLSFFYDQNALWNTSLKGNLRIILLNNSGGSIFRGLPGLSESAAADKLVAACHTTNAEGICTQNDIGYMAAHNMEEMQLGIVTLLTRHSERPMLLEVTTDAATDNRVMGDYFKSLKL